MIKQKNEINISQIIGRNFSRYAHTYDNHAQLQKLMAEKLASFLPSDTSEQILEIGSLSRKRRETPFRCSILRRSLGLADGGPARI